LRAELITLLHASAPAGGASVSA